MHSCTFYWADQYQYCCQTPLQLYSHVAQPTLPIAQLVVLLISQAELWWVHVPAIAVVGIHVHKATDIGSHHGNTPHIRRQYACNAVPKGLPVGAIVACPVTGVTPCSRERGPDNPTARHNMERALASVFQLLISTCVPLPPTQRGVSTPQEARHWPSWLCICKGSAYACRQWCAASIEASATNMICL